MEKISANDKLRKWLDDGGRKVVWLSKAVNADRATVHQWLNGKQKPRPVYRKALEEITGGEVGRDSW